MTGRRTTAPLPGVLFMALPMGLLGLAPASAQQPDRPFVVPQRDVDVLYAIPAAGGLATAGAAAADGATNGAAVGQRMRFSADPARQRVDPPGSGTFMITDYAAGHLTVVQPQRRTAIVLPAPGPVLARHGVRAAGAYGRIGDRVVAGMPCTDWSTPDGAGTPSVVCLTDDGVMLRASQNGRVLLQAVRVTYAPQPAAVFAVPDGFRTEAAPTP